MPFVPKLVVFDLDGTLIDYEHEHLFSEMIRILPSIGYPDITRERLEELFSHDDLFGFIKPGEEKAFEQTFWPLLNKHSHPGPKEIHGAIGVLAYLIENDIKAAIATARDAIPEELRIELKGTGLLPYVSVVAARENRELSWRDKAPQLQRIFTSLSVNPTSSFMVGDNPSDIQSSRVVGIGAAIAVLSGGIREEVLRKHSPDAVLKDIVELPELIETSR